MCNKHCTSPTSHIHCEIVALDMSATTVVVRWNLNNVCLVTGEMKCSCFEIYHERGRCVSTSSWLNAKVVERIFYLMPNNSLSKFKAFLQNDYFWHFDFWYLDSVWSLSMKNCKYILEDFAILFSKIDT